MKALTIKDLSITEELDAKGMTAVRGGFCGFTMPSCYSFPVAYKPSTVTTDVVISQANNQLQSNATGNGSAVFGGSISAYNNQQGSNHIG
ncbi:MAG: hypothetical protein JWR22_3357 [Herminiimonas sp.]|nr:hypothetical protein [Herminiimonas sp.]